MKGSFESNTRKMYLVRLLLQAIIIACPLSLTFKEPRISGKKLTMSFPPPLCCEPFQS